MASLGFTPVAALTAMVSSLGGCGGARVAPSPWLHTHPAVKWVFDAGHEPSLAWHLYPCPLPASISGAAVTGDRLLLLCNLGAPPEVLIRSRVYVLDLRTGRVLRNVQGPVGAQREPWALTENAAYVSTGSYPPTWTRIETDTGAVGHVPTFDPKWAEIDTRTGLVHQDRAPPADQVLAPATGLTWRGVSYDASGLWQGEARLAGGRLLTLSSVPSGQLLFEIQYSEEGHGAKRFALCHLPNRPWGGWGDPALIVDHDDMLVFCWRGFVISVDPRRFEIKD